MNIEDIIREMTPHVVGQKKLYDAEEIKRAFLPFLTPKTAASVASPIESNIEQQYPEATC